MRKFAEQIGISPVYLSNLENDRMPAPKDDVVSNIARQLHLNEADTAMLYDLAAKDVDATDEEWQEFIVSLEARRRKKQEGE